MGTIYIVVVAGVSLGSGGGGSSWEIFFVLVEQPVKLFRLLLPLLLSLSVLFYEGTVKIRSIKAIFAYFFSRFLVRLTMRF